MQELLMVGGIAIQRYAIKLQNGLPIRSGKRHVFSNLVLSCLCFLVHT
jgi:hypothetical protein